MRRVFKILQVSIFPALKPLLRQGKLMCHKFAALSIQNSPHCISSIRSSQFERSVINVIRAVSDISVLEQQTGFRALPLDPTNPSE